MTKTKQSHHNHTEHVAQDQANHGGHEHHKHAGHEVDTPMEHEHSGHANHQHAGHEQHKHSGHANHQHAGHEHHDHSAHANHQHAGHEHHDHSDHAGHDMHAGHGHHHHGNFKELFLKSLPLGIVIMVLSPMMGLTLPFQFTFPYSDILVSVVATILLFYGGKPFFQGAIVEFSERKPGMMALVSMGIAVAYLYSLYAVIARYTSGQHIMDFYFEFASLVLIMLLGHWIEMKAVGEAGDAQKSLAELIPKDTILLKEDGSSQRMAVADLQVGDVIRVQASENIPADGVIVQGESRINEALITGESKPILKQIDDKVIGGTTNGDSVIQVRVSETGEASFISQVQTLISQAQANPSRAETLASKVASWLFYIAVAAAVIAFVVWLFSQNLETAVTFAVTTLVIACPHALGLAIPLVTARSTQIGAQHGLLVKDRAALERASKASIMLLDKTGTLTTGEFKVLAVEKLSEQHSQEEILALLAGIESGSSHPIAQSITQYVKGEGTSPIAFDSIENLAGKGLAGQAQGHHYQLISQKAYGQDTHFDLPAEATVSLLLEDEALIAAIALGDELKASSPSLIASLKEAGIRPIMATGDNEAAAKAVAEHLAIDYYANQTPEDKYHLVEQFTQAGENVIMVGDGVNDAPSLALADVGIAIGAGTKVALDSADVVLTNSEPGDLAEFLQLAERTNRKMRQNLLWGAGYNFLAIPIAAGLLAPIGITLSPAVGAILMSLSTVIVALNAMTLRID